MRQYIPRIRDKMQRVRKEHSAELTDTNPWQLQGTTEVPNHGNYLDAVRTLRQDVTLACIDLLAAEATRRLVGETLRTYEAAVAGERGVALIRERRRLSRWARRGAGGNGWLSRR